MQAASAREVLSPAGWYPDPAGSERLRFWNGQSWTTELEESGPETQPQYTYGPGGAVEQVHQYS